jgi:hypothetical protein
MKRATLGFCGIHAVRVTAFGSVLKSDAEQRSKWLAQSKREGLTLRGAMPTVAEHLLSALRAWLTALRLQFHPTTWIAYAIGAFAVEDTAALATSPFWIGYAVLFLIEAATVFTNEVVDFPADIRNTRYGPFNGGSRVIVDKRISLSAMRRAAWVTSILASVLALVLAFATAAPPVTSLAVLAALAVLAIGYTAPAAEAELQDPRRTGCGAYTRTRRPPVWLDFHGGSLDRATALADGTAHCARDPSIYHPRQHSGSESRCGRG